MDPSPYDHLHSQHRRANANPNLHHHHHHHHIAGGNGGAAARSRYDSYEPHQQYLAPDHHHHYHQNLRLSHPPPPPPPPPPPSQHRHDTAHYAPPLRTPPDNYSSPPFHYHNRHDDDLRAPPHHDIRRVPYQHHHHQQLAWEEAEDERRRLDAAHQLRLSPPSANRKRHRCAMHDCGDLESTSSSGPPPRRSRQQPHPQPHYSQDNNIIDRINHPGYADHDGFLMHGESKGKRKMPMPTQMMLPDLPLAPSAGLVWRTPQKSALARVSVWERIEENPYVPSSAHPPQKEVHISPCKSNNATAAPKESVSAVSVDGKGRGADCNDGDRNAGMKIKNVEKNDMTLASVIVKASPDSKEKERVIENVTRKPVKVQKNVLGSRGKTEGMTTSPMPGVKKVRKVVVIKKVVKKTGEKGKQIRSSVVSEKRDSVDMNADSCEKEEGEITTSSFEKDVVSAHNLVSASDTVGVDAGEGAQKGESKIPTDLSENKAASAIESSEILDTAKVGGSEHAGKEEDRISMDSSDKNDACVCESGTSQKEEVNKILALSGEMNAVAANNSMQSTDVVNPHENEDFNIEDSKILKDLNENNGGTYMDGFVGKPDTSEVDGSEDASSEHSKVLIGANEEHILPINNFIGTQRTAEVSVCASENIRGKEDMISMSLNEKSVASLGDYMGAPWTTEVGLSEDAQNKEANILTHPSEKDIASVSKSGRTPNTVVVSVNEDIRKEEGEMPVESSEANAYIVHHSRAANTMEHSANEDIQKTEGKVYMESRETNASVVNHQVAKVNVSEFVDKEVDKGHLESSAEHAADIDNHRSTPEVSLGGISEDAHMEEQLLNEKAGLKETDAPLELVDTDSSNLPSSRNIEGTNLPPLDNDPFEDSTSAIILNDGIGRSTSSQADELMHPHRIHLLPEHSFALLCSGDSSSISANSEQSVPTALTLGNNIYCSSGESAGQHEENHEPLVGKQGLDAVIMTEFCSLEKEKGVTYDDVISAGVQNWLTLPSAVNNIAILGHDANTDAVVSKDSPGLNQSVSDDALASPDHSIRPVLDQCGSDDTFFSQDHSIRLCGSNRVEYELLASKESSEAVENQSKMVVSDSHSVNAINVIEQSSYQMMDNHVVDPCEPILSASQSADATSVEQVCSQLPSDSDHTYHNDTQDPVVGSSSKQDLLSSWIEAVVSEAKRELQPCKSTLPSVSSLDELLAPKEDNRKQVLDSRVHFVEKSASQMNLTISTLPKVTPRQGILPSSSREPPCSNHNARHRTWHRDNMVSSTSSSNGNSQPSGLPPKLPLKKTGKIQNSYIRKGNALIRNPATGNRLYSSSSLDVQNMLNKPVMRRSMNFVRKFDSNDFVAHSNISFERPKTPPLPVQTKSISCATDLQEPLSQALQKQQIPETEKEESFGQLSSGVDNPNIKSVQKSESLDASRVVYVKHKSNQLVAAQRPQPVDLINSSMEKSQSPHPSTTSDLYFKKRKNQIVLSSSPCDGQNMRDITPAEYLNSDDNKDRTIGSSNNSITVVKSRPEALQKTSSVGGFSHVWTLNGQQSLQQAQRKGFVGTSHMKSFPRILPWKRKIFCKNFRSSHTSLLDKSSFRIVRKLLLTRRRGMIYTVSTDGFSLRKSGVLGIGGSSLKWSRSLEKHSQKVNEEATLAVAEVERKKREKRKRQSTRNKGRRDRYSGLVTGNQLRNNIQASSDLKRLSNCNEEYVRVSKGNQLVRNPKKVICMLASEKVRWSLHTVRSRQAKKQQYCQFFTRFGECKKYGGNCPYIHDRAKVTICTKFLKGLCANANCKLTHKVLPERMPDCSYFLRGLCTNTACPYRHVNVNPKAPVCDDFLKGYCADGDECHRKHSYVCPIFEATGECPQRPRCKLHHPKKKIRSSKRRRLDVLKNSSWGRYFDSNIGNGSETMKTSSDEEDRQKRQDVYSAGDHVEFISLGVDDDDSATDVDAANDIQIMEVDTGNFNMQAENLDALIKPLRIMRTARA